MVSFGLTIYRLLKAILRSWGDPEFRAALTLTIITLFSGTIAFRSFEGWSWLDALYFSVATVSTVGYGDIAPVTSAGKIFAIFYIFVGIGVFVVLITKLAQALLKKSNKQVTKEENSAPKDQNSS